MPCRPGTLARWPALYVTWAEASDFCRAQGKRLPTRSRVGKGRTGREGQSLSLGSQTLRSWALAMFGQYHVHEIPIVASVESGEEGPKSLRPASYGGECRRVGRGLVWDRLLCDHARAQSARSRSMVATRWCAVDRGRARPPLLRTATRSGASPDQRAATIGFRCARSAR